MRSNSNGRRYYNGNTMRMYTQRRAYRSNYKNNFSQNTTKTGRDQASFTVQSEANAENFFSNGLNGWACFRMSPAFNAVANMFEQVAIQGITVQISLTNVLSVNTADNVNGAVQFVRAWDRDGVYTNVDAFASTDPDKQAAIFQQLIQTSSAQIANVGISSAVSATTDRIWASSMAEKSMFVATELLANQFDVQTQKFSDLMQPKLSAWNPTILLCLQPGFKASCRVLLKYHIVCRGVRILQGLENVIQPENKIDINGSVRFIVKEWVGLANAQGTNFANPANVSVKYYESGPNAVSNYSVSFYTQNKKYPEVPVMTATELNRVKHDDEGIGGFVYASTFQDRTDAVVQTFFSKKIVVPVINDRYYDQDTMRKPAAAYISYAEYADPKRQYYHSTASNAYFTSKTAGVQTYAAESAELESLALRVDGAQCYSAEKGGIYAEGYIDLNGPDPVDTDEYADEEHAAGAAFTRVGDIVYGTTEANEALLQYNIENTGPQYIEVQDATPATLLAGEYETTDAAGVIYNDNVVDHYDDISLAPSILAGLGDMKIVIALSVVCGQYTSSSTYNFGDLSSEKVVNFMVEATLPDEEGDNTAQLATTASIAQTFSITNAQLLALLRMGFLEENVSFEIEVPRLNGSPGMSMFTFSNALSVGELLQIPVTASKFWSRIKGFFTSAWKAIKNIVPKVTKVVSPILPPPYGTVVAGIGAGVSAVDNVINTITTASVKQTELLAGAVNVEDTDVFEVTPQFRIQPYVNGEATAVDVTTSPDTEWQNGESFTVKVNLQEQVTTSSRMQFSDYPILHEALRQFRSNILQSGGSLTETPAMGLQQRAKIKFFKPCTEAQAQNYKTTIRLGVTQTLDYGDDEVEINSPEDVFTE